MPSIGLLRRLRTRNATLVAAATLLWAVAAAAVALALFGLGVGSCGEDGLTGMDFVRFCEDGVGYERVAAAGGLPLAVALELIVAGARRRRRRLTAAGAVLAVVAVACVVGALATVG